MINRNCVITEWLTLTNQASSLQKIKTRQFMDYLQQKTSIGYVLIKLRLYTTDDGDDENVSIDVRTSSCQRFKHNTSFMSRLSTRRKDASSNSSSPTVILPMTAPVGGASPFASPQHLPESSSLATRLRSTNVLLSPYSLSESCDGRLQNSTTDTADLQRWGNFQQAKARIAWEANFAKL